MVLLFMRTIPKVTVLMPVYNGEKYLCEAIDSILNQSFTDFEFLIINDGSTDSTENIILSYTDSRIRYIKNQENIKLIATLNKGIDLALGKYIARMDADDISLPERLQKQFDYLESNQNVGIIGAWYQSFNNQSIISVTKYPENHHEIMFSLFAHISICHGTMMFRKSLVRNGLIRYDNKYHHAEDYDLISRVIKCTKVHNLQEILYYVRKHDDEVSNQFNDEQKINSIKVRQNIFSLLSVTITTTLLDGFTLLLYQNYTYINQSVNEIKVLLETILRQNKIALLFPETFLKYKLSFIWFHYCYHVTNYKTYKSSSELANIPVSFYKRIKWLFK